MALLAHVSAGYSGSGPITTGPVNCSGASLIIITAGWFNYSGGVCSVSDSQGNTYTGLTGQSSGSLNVRLFYCLVPSASSSMTFTIDPGTGNSLSTIEVQAWSGFSSYLTQNGATSGGSFSTCQPGSVTTAVNGALIVTGVNTAGLSSPLSINSGFTISDSGEPNSTVAAGMAYLVQSTAGTINPTWTFANYGVPVAVIAAFGPSSPSESTQTSFTVGVGLAITVPPVPAGSATGATIGVGMVPAVTGGGVSEASTTAATIGVNLAVAVGTGVAEASTTGATIGVALAISIGSTGVYQYSSTAATIGVDLAVALGALPFGASCPLNVAFPGVPYSQKIPTAYGTAPYSYSIVSSGFSPSQLNIVCLGDSMTKGYPVDPGGSYPTQLKLIVGTSNISNLGINGEKSSGVLSTEVPSAISLYDATKQNVACVWCGINDIGTGVSLATLKANYVSIVSALKAAGFFVIALTLPPSNYTGGAYVPGYAANVPPFNAWILAGSSGADVVCNSGQDTLLSNPANFTYFYTDELHLITAGYNVVATDVGEIILGGLPPGFSLNTSTGFISGTTTLLGNYPYTIQVSDSAGHVVQFPCQISVASPTGARRPLNMLTSKEWAAISEKGISGILQTDAYVDQAWPNAGIHVWPVPSKANVLQLTYWSQVASFGTVDDTFQLPPAYYEALKYALAVQTSQSYKRQVSPAIAKIAAAKKAAIQLINAQILEGSFSTGQSLDNANVGEPTPKALEPKK